MVLTWPGVPVTAWAIIRPSVSNTPADRSPASRTLVLKAVRTRLRACSSTTEISRFHITCRAKSRAPPFGSPPFGSTPFGFSEQKFALSANGCSEKPWEGAVTG